MCTDAHICISYSDSYTPKRYFVQCLYQLCQHARRCNIISTAITTGKIIATSIPALRLSATALDTNPTSVGPPEHPRSPASASSANIAVPPIITQNTLLLLSSSIVIPLSPSSINGAIGAFAKTNALITGINAQMHASIFQFAMPKMLKKTVDNSTTPTCPQQ